MPSQYGMQNRRKFIKLSVLGAGGVFASSALLQSCSFKDHDIPNPEPPIDPPVHPPLVGMEVDWNDAAKTAVTTGISLLVPEGGEILSGLIGVFWPSTPQESVWDQVKAQVEALVDQQIGAFEYELVTESLDGLEGVMKSYVLEMKDGTNEEKLVTWINISLSMTENLPRFQASGYQLPLLGLFVQYANMYLSVLRDVVLKGKEWGRTDADQMDDVTKLTYTIQAFNDYVYKTYGEGRAALVAKTTFNHAQAEPFRTVNAYDRQMTFLALDFVNTWYAFNAFLYPHGDNVVFTREIYSDPFGEGNDPDNPLKVAEPWPNQLPTQIDAWSGKYFNAIQMSYPPGSGPKGATQTPRYGDQESTTYHDTYNLNTTNPIVQAGVSYGSYVNGIQFFFADNTTTKIHGSSASNNFTYAGYTNSALSSAVILGNVSQSESYAADVIVFGFKYWQSPSEALKALANLYITSPSEKSEADLVKSSPKLGISGLITEELKAARQAYWAAVKKRADEIGG